MFSGRRHKTSSTEGIINFCFKQERRTLDSLMKESEGQIKLDLEKK